MEASGEDGASEVGGDAVEERCGADAEVSEDGRGGKGGGARVIDPGDAAFMVELPSMGLARVRDQERKEESVAGGKAWSRSVVIGVLRCAQDDT